MSPHCRCLFSLCRPLVILISRFCLVKAIFESWGQEKRKTVLVSLHCDCCSTTANRILFNSTPAAEPRGIYFIVIACFTVGLHAYNWTKQIWKKRVGHFLIAMLILKQAFFGIEKREKHKNPFFTKRCGHQICLQSKTNKNNGFLEKYK